MGKEKVHVSLVVIGHVDAGTLENYVVEEVEESVENWIVKARRYCWHHCGWDCSPLRGDA